MKKEAVNLILESLVDCPEKDALKFVQVHLRRILSSGSELNRQAASALKAEKLATIFKAYLYLGELLGRDLNDDGDADVEKHIDDAVSSLRKLLPDMEYIHSWDD